MFTSLLLACFPASHQQENGPDYRVNFFLLFAGQLSQATDLIALLRTEPLFAADGFFGDPVREDLRCLENSRPFAGDEHLEQAHGRLRRFIPVTGIEKVIDGTWGFAQSLGRFRLGPPCDLDQPFEFRLLRIHIV